uniref:EF-hand domain-containing protein n=1 Tax=Lepisosteus oculatus TaxID=7918 RepID=W5M8B8_LEPOC
GEEEKITHTFSEEHLLNITFEACDTTGRGEVMASTVMQYLQSMTSQSPEQGRLSRLYDMLDPDRKGVFVNRDVFQATMKRWISQCSQDCYLENVYQRLEWCNISKTLAKATVLDFPRIALVVTVSHVSFLMYSSESRDMISTVADLRHANHSLSEQNSSLLKAVEACDEKNLQLTAEVSKLKRKLMSTQRSAVSFESLSEELDEARRLIKDSQERACRIKTYNNKLKKENECLRAQIQLLEEVNEKLAQEKSFNKTCLAKLMKMQSEMRKELDETHVLLASKDREITQKTMLIEELKFSQMENHRIIEGMYSEVQRLQENARHGLL